MAAAAGGGGQQRALVIAGLGFALVLALFVGSRVLAGGGGGEDGDSAGPVFPTDQRETTPGTPALGDREKGIPVTPIPLLPDAFELAEVRDPFTPPLSVVDFLRSLQPDPGTPGTPGGPGGGGLSPGDVVLRRVAVDPDNGDPFATLAVGGEIFETNAGERFGPNGEFMVVSLDVGTECGTFLFGDESFSLCVGQQGATPGAGPVPQK